MKREEYEEILKALEDERDSELQLHDECIRLSAHILDPIQVRSQRICAKYFMSNASGIGHAIGKFKEVAVIDPD